MPTVPPPGATCHAHPDAMGVVACRACGSFLCRACARKIADAQPGHLCATCAEAESPLASPSDPARRRRLSVLSMIVLAGLVLVMLGSTMRLAERRDIATLVVTGLCVALVVGMALHERRRSRR